MEDHFVTEFVNFYDNQSLKDYGNKIRTEIINGFEDLRKRDSNFSGLLSNEERRFWTDIKNNFVRYGQDTSEEKVKSLASLIEIYDCLGKLISNNSYFRHEVNRIKSLVNED